MRAFDICAGAGGLSMGLQDAGFTVLGVDNVSDAIETHRANVGPCDLADVTTWTPPHDVDLVAGSPPCQSFSAAGNRQGTNDPRGTIYRHLIRVAVEANARAILLENVEGMTTWFDYDGVSVLHRIKSDMRAAGFEPTHAVLNAASFGVPQMRRRLFIVAFRNEHERSRFRWPSPTHADGPNVFGLPPYATVRQALNLGDGDYDVGRPEGASGWQGMRNVDVDAPGYAIGTRGNADKISPLDRPAPTISAGGTETGGAEPIVNAKVRAGLHEALAVAGILDRPSTVVQCILPAGHHDLGYSKGAVRLSAEQCAVLQDFPPGFAFIGKVGSTHSQIGNAVPRRLGAAVARAIADALSSDEAARECRQVPAL